VACNDLCNQLTTTDQALGVYDILADDVDPDDYPSCHENISSVAECNACIGSLPLLEGDCSVIAFMCGL
jgi:hypothetical protein